MQIASVRHSSFDEEWTQPWGENKLVRNHCNEMAVTLRGAGDVALTLRARAFDDGVAFRYEWRVAGCDTLAVTDELTEFRFADEPGTLSWSIPGNFETYELQYRELPVAEVADANTPFTFRTAAGLYGSVHEAALYDYPEMVLRRDSAGVLKADLAPLPDGVKAYVPATFTTPWRTVQIGSRAVDLINSALILNLNEPSKIADTSWITPQKYVGVWWGMHLGTQVWTMGPRHGATTDNALRHIDFAAENNIQGVLFEGWNKGWENWGGNQHFDYVEPYADFDLERIAAYARERGSSCGCTPRRAATSPNSSGSWRLPCSATPSWASAPSRRVTPGASRAVTSTIRSTACSTTSASSRRRPATASCSTCTSRSRRPASAAHGPT